MLRGCHWQHLNTADVESRGKRFAQRQTGHMQRSQHRYIDLKGKKRCDNGIQRTAIYAMETYNVHES